MFKCNLPKQTKYNISMFREERNQKPFSIDIDTTELNREINRMLDHSRK